ncbi:hypothetical protein Patl1_08869 [Pistacia atlantica]|uniref:Uncharacterized protein n=1 Tax=Pistacia atlantica TaxID=434234 RepID=A0ACC1AKF2_9ROSI|nr:hypothetical protein Patl1_08869 [Pistacia atlantica]
MAHQENCAMVTRDAKKRAALGNAEKQPPKQRVALGELPNLSKPVVSKNPSVKSQPQKPKGKVDIDAKSDDPQMCGPYVSDIYEYLRTMEVDPKRRPLPDYIEKDALYLSISYIDGYLSSNVLNRERLQLLGVSSMLIASKYEEVSPKNVETFCHITDNKYTKDEVVKMEADILKALNFELGNPTIKTFLWQEQLMFTRVAQGDYKVKPLLFCYSVDAQNLRICFIDCLIFCALYRASNLQLEFLGYYLAELSLLDYACLKFLPSLVAASVIFLARFIICPGRHPWSSTLQQYTSYKPSEIKECVLIIHDLYLSRRGGGLQAVREKYKQHKVRILSNVWQPWLLLQGYLFLTLKILKFEVDCSE